LISGIYKLIDSSLVHEQKFDIVSNNLSNLDTEGFKKDLISFHRTLAMQNATAIDFSPGPVRYTGNTLDVALDTPGFFKLQTPRGVRYTRDGSFKLNAEGMLVTSNGDSVLGENGPISINGNDVKIANDGTVVVDGGTVGRMLLVDFEQKGLLKKETSSCYLYQGDEKDAKTAEAVEIQQGYVEESNVNLTEEMIKLIETQRACETAQKAIQVFAEVNSKLVGDASLFQ